MEGTLSRADGRYVLRIERRIGHPPERVWAALTDPAELSHWFPAELSGELVAGAKLTFTFRQGEAPPSYGEVLAVEPGRLFEFSWQGEVLRWEVSPDAAGCRLRFTHTFDDGPGAASFATGWETCLDALGARLDGRPAETSWSAEKHDAYVEAFGLDEGEREADEVRFVRQLTKPAEVVWPLLLELAGEITERDEPRLLAYRRGQSAARWELAPGPGGARVTLRITGGDPAQTYPAAKHGLDALATHLRDA